MATPKWWQIILLTDPVRYKKSCRNFYFPIFGDTVLKIPISELPFNVKQMLSKVKNINNYLEIYEKCSSLLTYNDYHNIYKLAYKWKIPGKHI